MKHFLCAFDALYLGLRADRVERVFSLSAARQLESGAGEEGACISLPALFGRAGFASPHGIVLKPFDNEKKITLLSPPLDIDVDIPEESVYSLPRALQGGLRFASGACFLAKEKERLVLILDLEKISREGS
ncbi:MAG: hypothetical protein LBU82_07120 [Treponema sp.]|jgi:hypothetical protein|nr:hypothetical protein [Treponema sp.]